VSNGLECPFDPRVSPQRSQHSQLRGTPGKALRDSQDRVHRAHRLAVRIIDLHHARA
jgi:hypothetical protein